jgi:two-component system response regulator (stage 0 sporulation protein F)
MKKKTTVLYIDDEPINLMIFESIFARNYRIITAATGFEGLEKLNSNPGISVVISDMKMPGMNGVEFIKHAKKDFPDNIYFILTGYEITEEIAEALNNKLIVKYFRKPFNVEEIIGSIEESLK